MGEIADSIINGELDSITGEYLGKPCGYPRTIHEEPKKSISNNRARNGVQIYLRKNNINDKAHGDIVLKFIKEQGQPYRKFTKQCIYIQNHWPQFVQFITKFLKN